MACLRIIEETKEQADKRLEKEIRKYLVVQTSRSKRLGKRHHIVKFYQGYRSPKLACKFALHPKYMIHTNHEAYSLERREAITKWLDENGFTTMAVYDSWRTNHRSMSFYKYKETERISDGNYNRSVETGKKFWKSFFYVHNERYAQNITMFDDLRP